MRRSPAARRSPVDHSDSGSGAATAPPYLARVEGPAARANELAAAIARRIRSRPLTTIALTIGLGFIAGGALSFRTGRIALGAAARHVARELLKQLL
jgi:hypothetical protein